MSDKAIVELRQADYDDSELLTVAATLAGLDPGVMCEVVAVMIYHPEPGQHALGILTSTQDGAAHAAGLLQHAAEHLTGSCRQCARRNRKAGRRV